MIRLFLLVSILFFGSFAYAETLTSVANVRIKDTKVELVNSEYILSFSASNDGNTPIRGVFGLRVQNKIGKQIFSDSEKHSVVLKSKMPLQARIPFMLPNEPDTYTIFAVVGSENGIPLAVLKTDSITIKNPNSPNISISNCEYKNENISCEATNTDLIKETTYRLFKGGTSGEMALEGKGSVTNEKNILFSLQENLQTPGRYVGVFSFFDAIGNLLSTIQYLFVKEGDWLKFDLVSVDNKNGIFKARIFLSGENSSGKAGILYWIIDKYDNICARGEKAFETELIREYKIKKKVTDCFQPRLVALTHTGKNSNEEYSVSDTYGDVDFVDLIHAESTIAENETFGFRKNPIGLAVLLISFVIILFIVFKNALRISLFIALLFLGANIASADTFISGNDVFTVTLEKSTYQNTETIDFTLNLEDRVSGAKPVGDRVMVKIDNDSYTEIVSITNTANSYSVSLPQITTGGVHTLNFKVPGHLFGLSMFGKSRFGIGDRLFSVQFNVQANNAPNPPQIDGSCEIGSDGTFYVQSEDTNGDNILYEYDWSDIAGSPNGNLPNTGYVASNTRLPVTHHCNTQDTFTLNARAKDVNGLYSSWNAFTVIPVSPCDHCIYDGSSASNIFIATPDIVLEGQVTMLSWSLKNVTNCSISGTNEHTVNWDTIRVTQSATTPPITQLTTYTLSCMEVGGQQVTSTAVINLAPEFEEI